MNRNRTIAARLQEVLLDGHWIANTNYQEQLLSTNWQQATQTVMGLNSIAALTYHINYYLGGLLRAFENGDLQISDRFSFDVPEIKSQEDWKRLVADFLANARRFVAQIKQLEDAVFDEPFLKPQYGTYLRNIEGVIEHSYYHLGQMVLIQKVLAQL